MKFRDIWDLTLGRLYLPQGVPGSPQPGELWLISAGVQLRNLAGTVTSRLLTSAEFNQALGVPQLDANGQILAAQVPGTNGIVGSYLEWGGDPNAPPSNYLVCDGSEQLISVYPTLYAVIGHRNGRPSSSLTFRLPDSIGRVTIGGWTGLPSAGVPAQLHRVIVSNPGGSYTNGTSTVALVGGTNTIVGSASITIAGGIVTQVDVISCGNYTSASGVTLTPPGAGSGFACSFLWVPVTPTTAQSWRVRITARGTGYAQATTSVNFSSGFASGVAVVSGGEVVEIIIPDHGVGVPGAVTITGAGAGATAVIEQQPSFYAPGDYGGEARHQLVVAELAAHTHPIQQNATFGAGAFGGLDSVGSSNNTTSTGGNQGHNIMQSYMAVTRLIRYQ